MIQINAYGNITLQRQLNVQTVEHNNDFFFGHSMNETIQYKYYLTEGVK